MRDNRIWARLLRVECAVVERVELEGEGEDAALVVHVRPYAEDCGRCSVCRRPCAGYDAGGGRRRWRALDLGVVEAYLEADAPRVQCAQHGVVVAHVPWARAAARFTRDFEDTVAWLVTHTDKTTVSTMMRISWRAVGSIIGRVTAEARGQRNPFDGVRRIGIDEVSYRRGHRYLTVVVDHETGRLLFAHPGKDAAALNAFFDALGEDGCSRIELISMDAAPWYRDVVVARCRNAKTCTDPFHVVKWATEAVDKVRRHVWNDARRRGLDGASDVKGARYALLKNPENLNDTQREKLATVAAVNAPLFRAYLLKEQLRLVFKLRGEQGLALLRGWLAWAQRARLPEFRDVASTIKHNFEGIAATLRYGLSNARVESLNTRMQLLTRLAFGFHSAHALIAMAMLKLGGMCPPLPGRTTHENVR
jgi:transposase